jgi:starch synthase
VVDIADDPEAATGIKFDAYSARALAKAIRKALVLYATPRLLHGMRRRGMETDFSWSHTAGIYVDFYKELLGVRG